MRRRTLRHALVVLSGALLSVASLASTPDLGNFSVFGGGKLLKKDDWAPADQQWDIGGQIAYQPANWPLGFAAAYFSSYGKGSTDFGEFKGYTHEIQLGLEKIWAVGRFSRPYVGGGVVLGKAEASLQTVQDSDHAVGGWIGGGYTLVLARHLALGIDSRYTYLPIRLFDTKGQGGGLHLGATLGFAW